MSDGGRERASLGVKVWKSSQMWSVQRSAVRSIAWLDLRVHFKACNRARLSTEDEKRTLAANEGKRLFRITRRLGVNYDAIADELPQVGGLCSDPLLLVAHDSPQGNTSDPHESGTEYQPLLHRGIVDEIEGESGNPLSRPELCRSMSAGRKDD
jgi:hypothetical protein